MTSAGGRNASGAILAKVLLGRSAGRLARLVPVTACTTSCVRVASLQMTAKPVSTCQSANDVTAVLTATDETGKRLAGVSLTGRFLDDYWLNQTVTGTTKDRKSVV